MCIPGCAVLGVDTVDTWFGTNQYKDKHITVYEIWQRVKQRAGYTKDGQALRVGYSDQPVSNPVISAEWTFGAINMCLVAAAQYGDQTSPHYNLNWASDLLADAQSMASGVQALFASFALDDLQSTDMVGDVEAYYYANARYNIPFGWWANKLPSLCSTAWSLMIENGFNPFALGGTYTDNTPTYRANPQHQRDMRPILQFKDSQLPRWSKAEKGCSTT